MSIFSQRLRFSDEQDIRLLELVIEINPFEDTQRWKTLREGFVKEFKKQHSVGACKSHVDLLIRNYLKDANKNAFVSDKYVKLIDNVIELKRSVNEANLLKHRKSMKSEKDDNFDVNDESQSGFNFNVKSQPCSTDEDEQSEKDSENTNSFMKNTGNIRGHADVTLLAYLRNKFSTEKETKEKELALKERKLALREKELELHKEKLDLEKLERSKRLEMELKERELHMKVIQQQQKLINMYMKNNQY